MIAHVKYLPHILVLAGGLALTECGGSSDDGNGNGNGGENGNKDEFTNARCIEINGPGHIANSDGDGCIDDPDYVSSDAKSATAKALLAALGLAEPSTAVTPASIPARTADDPRPAFPAITLKKSSTSVDPLNGWQGADYKGDGTEGTGATAVKYTGEVRAYSNKGAAERQPFAMSYAAVDNRAYYEFIASGGNPSTGELISDYDKISISSSSLKDNGRQTLDVNQYSGSYDGASGSYTCIIPAGCQVNVVEGKITGITPAQWRFTPGSGATAPKGASDYLEFGWWVRKGKDGPVDAGTFARSSGGTAITDAAANTIVGSATYEGSAAGKFAISNSALPAQDNSGHFTADAMLKANFDATTPKLSGTIDNFTLNETTKGTWVVSLEEHAIAGVGVAAGQNAKTKWSLDGTNFGAAGGDWEASFYDVNDKGNSTTPNSVIGKFEASISSTHHLEGAFGATN